MFKWDYDTCRCFTVENLFYSLQFQRVYDGMNVSCVSTIECNFTEDRNNQWKELLPLKPKPVLIWNSQITYKKVY